MKTRLENVVVVLMALCFFGANGASAQVSFPRPVSATELNWVTSNATGVVRWISNGWIYRGSGAVARDSRLVYTCAHVLEESGRLAEPDEIRFIRRYHSYSSPSGSTGATPRSYRYFTSYSSTAQSYGSSSRRAYHLDLVILVGYSSFGSPQPYYAGNGGNAIAWGGQWKYIGGYPASLDYGGRAGYHLQHRTPFFSRAGRASYGGYYTFNNVSTGGGNSGGPVWVYDGSRWGLAAVLVSGTSTTCGVRVLDSAAQRMGTNAVSDARN